MMLSRAASDFYWMGRYVERAQSLSRLLLVQISEMPEDSSEFVSISWKGIFESMKIPPPPGGFSLKEKGGGAGLSDDFLLADAYTLADYLTFEAHHPGSVLSCLRMARENARKNQEKITRLMWPHINRSYLDLKKTKLADLWPDKMIALYKNILEFGYLFYGLAQNSLRQDEGAHFIQMGHYLERFQNTASVFESHIRLMIHQKEGEEADLIGLLCRCGAFDNYRQSRSLNLSLRKTADFLIYAEDFPRSLKFCANKIKESLLFIEKKGELNRPIYESLERIEGRLGETPEGRPLADFLKSLYQESLKADRAVDEAYFSRAGFFASPSGDQ